jgi:DNA/RNA-binding domain of Phe-tRNA-synthetase-like protein
VHFNHSSEIWRGFPELVAGVLLARGVDSSARVSEPVARFHALAAARLAASPEAELPEVQAWRRAFSRMGLKPTQYRSAAESLLRRFRKEGGMPSLHPMIDLCNAISLAFAIPIAVFDVARVSQYLEVRHATGSEDYRAFSGDTEHPEPREVIFADAEARAHARRWSHRQSAFSAVRDDTTTVLIVVEAMHASALEDLQRLTAALQGSLAAIGAATASTAILKEASPRFEW